MSARRHARAIGLLPGTVGVVGPAIILWRTEAVTIGWGLRPELAVLPTLLGAALIGLGLVLVAWTVGLFAVEGEGTIAPWDPTSRLVLSGPYRHVRNPMLSGVGCVLAGEAMLFGSPPLGLWLVAFLVVNVAYLPLVEEPGLSRRFGEEYEAYRTNVPRWVPRLRPWEPPPHT